MVEPAQKIGIVTLYGLFNYGNRLQDLAIHTLLRDRGYFPESIIVRSKSLRTALRDAARTSYSVLLPNQAKSRRHNRFRSFDRNVTHRRYWSASQLRRAAMRYGCFIAGSDQIWNPYDVNSKALYFLDFASRDQRIALAPSFGVDTIPSELVPEYTKWLSGFPVLSVREETGAALIRDLTGRRAQVLIDPTLVLDSHQWRSLADNSLRPDRSYLVTYFLGRMNESRTTLIEDFANKHNLLVVHLSNPDLPEFYEAGPAEFLDLIDNAACVFTDSFHGSAFSLLFDTPLVIFDREGSGPDMSSRLSTFAETFALSDRMHPHCDLEHCMSVDYTEAHKVLEVKRREFHDYLDQELARVARSSTA